MQEKFNLEGKTALITGGAGLLGIQHALALLEINCRVIITDISKENLLKAELEILKKNKDYDISIFVMDVTEKASIKECEKYFSNQNIFVDILINNAAIDPKVSKDSNVQNSSRFENFIACCNFCESI